MDNQDSAIASHVENATRQKVVFVAFDQATISQLLVYLSDQNLSVECVNSLDILTTIRLENQINVAIFSDSLPLEDLTSQVRMFSQTMQLIYYSSTAYSGKQVQDIWKAGFNELIDSAMPLEEQNARVLNQLSLYHDVQGKNTRLDELQLQYELAMQRCDELELLAKADPITGLYNRRYMVRKLQEEASRLQRTKSAFSMLLIDLDDFSGLNSIESREIGDRILQDIGATLTNSCRTYDVVGRWSGDQFLMLLPETDLTWALVVAERCRKNIANYVLVRSENHLVNVTASVGVAEYRLADGVGDSMHRVELALREAKQRDRNCVVFNNVIDGLNIFQIYSPGQQKLSEHE